jgi:hypothetical protein
MKRKILFKRLMFLMLQWFAFTTLQAQSSLSQGFTYTGTNQTFTVPSNVHQITVKLWGGGGAGGNYTFNDIGGGGGFAMATLNVNPGELYTIIVGGGGLPGAGPGAYGGGGAKDCGVGGRGGGRSAIRNALHIELITAGAGGGGGGVSQADQTGGHGGGGLSGEPDNWLPYGGGAGTQTAGGIGGHRQPTDPRPNAGKGDSGSLFRGGKANCFDNGYNGSGGGGYYGGGSGTDYGDGAGGGGSSFIPDGGTTIAASSNIPGNILDEDYADSAGYGGARATAGNPGRVVIEYTPGNTCLSPSGLMAVRVEDTAAVLKWHLSGANISNVWLRFRAAGDAVWLIRKRDAATTNLRIHGLMPNTTYQWQVRSLCTEDTSAYVKGPDFTTAASFAFSSTTSAITSSKLPGNIHVQIMPNPNKGNFSIQLQLPAEVAITTLALYNNMGEKVWQQEAGKISGAVYKNISLQNQLPAGTYMMVVQRSDVRLTQKVMISK